MSFSGVDSMVEGGCWTPETRVHEYDVRRTTMRYDVLKHDFIPLVRRKTQGNENDELQLGASAAVGRTLLRNFKFQSCK
jgi:hypothetical protein